MALLQTTDTLLLIRPSHFGFNSETADSNRFQQPSTVSVIEKGLAEFNAFADKLTAENINLLIFEDDHSQQLPDAVFPNNWISMHHDGRVVLYPMMAASRRRERRTDIIDQLKSQYGFHVSEIIDLTSFEKKQKYLEGTGSIVFDHFSKTAFMAISERSHPDVLNQFCYQTGYTPLVFSSNGPSNTPVYHTNVILSIGCHFAVVCTSWIPDLSQCEQILKTLELAGKTIIEISAGQAVSFAGNMLEIKTRNNDPCVILSETALKSLNRNQIRLLEQNGSLLPCSIPNIEKHGGGSVRCMIAEVFLPQEKSETRISIISPKSQDEFREYFALRWSVLRKPWNQPHGSEQDDLEESSSHFMAVTGSKRIVGTGRVQFNNNQTAQIRYMAIDPGFQSKGIGKQLMKAMEAHIKEAGFTTIFLQARENAVPFYLSLGFEIIEKTFLLYGDIQHFSMKKEL